MICLRFLLGLTTWAIWLGWNMGDKQESRAVAGKPHVRCCCKFRYVSKFTAASRGSPSDSTTFLFPHESAWYHVPPNIAGIQYARHVTCDVNTFRCNKITEAEYEICRSFKRAESVHIARSYSMHLGIPLHRRPPS